MSRSKRPSLANQLGRACRCAALSFVLALAACKPQPTTTSAVAAHVALGEPVSLAMNGFNYTDEYIDQFIVDGTGGGNLYVSSPTSGGGGTVCCVTWRPGTALPRPMKVEWTRDRKRWCEKTVQLAGPVPEKPTAIGVHFMPDGDIQVEITQGEADPKIKLARFNAGQRKESGNVTYDEHFAKCQDAR